MSHDPTDSRDRPPITLSYRQITRIVWRRVIHHPVIPTALASVILAILGLLYLAGTWVLTKWLGSWDDRAGGPLIVVWLLTSFVMLPAIVMIIGGLIVALIQIGCSVCWNCWNCCRQLHHDVEYDIYEKMARSA
jgi:hypothetical protein